MKQSSYVLLFDSHYGESFNRLADAITRYDLLGIFGGSREQCRLLTPDGRELALSDLDQDHDPLDKWL